MTKHEKAVFIATYAASFARSRDRSRLRPTSDESLSLDASMALIDAHDAVRALSMNRTIVHRLETSE